MRLPTIPVALAAVTVLLLTPTPATAHGGTYRGPGEISIGGGASGGGDRGANRPGGVTAGGGSAAPTGPTTAGPTTAGPTPGRAGGAAPRGIQIEEDLGSWHYWWEFNKDSFLNLRATVTAPGARLAPDDKWLGRGSRDSALQVLQPSRKEVNETVVPVLKGLLRESGQRDITSSCLMALAKIGADDNDILALVKTCLSDGDQEISETAALALGITASAKGLADLLALWQDSAAGRDLVGRSTGVPFRTRAFAAFGLGMLASRQTDTTIRTRVAEAMLEALGADHSHHDLQVAAVEALGMLGAGGGDKESIACTERVVRALTGFLRAARPTTELARAHVPTALARLVAEDEARRSACLAVVRAVVEDERESEVVREASILAIGRLARPEDGACSALLESCQRRGRHGRAGNFAVLALGLIGGAANRTRLLGLLEDVKKVDKPWAAIALGVQHRRALDRDRSTPADSAAGEAIVAQLKANKNPRVVGGLCIALGLLGHTAGADAVLETLRAYERSDEACGYACLALGLMGHRPARDEIQRIVDDSLRRPERLRQAAIGLGLLGDKAAAETLLERLEEAGSLAVFGSVASALGAIGDRRSIDPLLGLAGDQERGALSRAFAVVALGIVSDREMTPWNARIAAGMNYLATTETLFGSGTGILDIF